MKRVDLHLHTHKSDGSYSAEEVVRLAQEAGLSAISITDHDSVAAIPEGLSEARKYGIELIPGVELSGEEEISGKNSRDVPAYLSPMRPKIMEVHILGYYLDWQDKVFQEKLTLFSEARLTRAKKILEKLAKKKIYLELRDVLGFAPSSKSVGRLHIAQALVKEKYVNSVDKAFNLYLGNNRPCYVSKYHLTPEQAIQLIKQARGIPVFAHPGLVRLDFLIPSWIKAGLRGIETYYPGHNSLLTRHYEELARKYNLLVTGGSDFHGQAKPDIRMGCMDIPYNVVERLKEEVG